MPSQISQVANLADVVPLAIDFASRCGFQTTAPNGVTMPSGYGFSLDVTDLGLGWTAEDGGCAVVAPYRGGPDNPATRGLTKAFFFGSKPADTPTLPYLAIVLSFGFNLVRHLYIGSLDKLGGYDGGEICAANSPCDLILANEFFNFNDRRQRFLFNGFQTGGRLIDCGFVRVTGNDNSRAIRNLRTPYSQDPTADFGIAGALGGFNDEISDYLMIRGNNTFSQGPMMTPVNLYASNGVFGHIPLGRAPGVAHVNMTNLQSEDQVLFGTTPFRCFPEFARSSTTGFSTQNARPLNNSYLAGLAYVDDGAP